MFILSTVILPAAILYILVYCMRATAHYHSAAVGILFTCLLASGFAQSYVFNQALVKSYSRETGWLSDEEYYEPHYEDEDIPQTMLLLGPIAGFIIMLIAIPRSAWKKQVITFLLLVVFVYPVLSVIVLSSVGGTRPRLYTGTVPLPAIGTRVPTRP